MFVVLNADVPRIEVPTMKDLIFLKNYNKKKKLVPF